MNGRQGVVRVALSSEDPYVQEQVRRVAEAVGAVVVGLGEPRPPDLVLVEGRPDRAGVPSGVPLVRVEGGRSARIRADAPLADGDVLALPGDAEALLRHLATLACPPRARVVAVTGARGGSGASTLAAALARVAVREGTVSALVDLDAAGGGLDVLLGIEHEPGPRWADLRRERAGFPPEALSAALPAWRGVRVLSCDVRGGPVRGEPARDAALRALGSANDLLVLDVPRALWEPAEDDGGRDLPPCQAVLVVAGCDVRSAMGAASLRRAMPEADLRLVARFPGHGGLHPEEVADAADIPLAATLRSERGGTAATENGRAPADNRRGAVARAAARLWAGLVPAA